MSTAKTMKTTTVSKVELGCVDGGRAAGIGGISLFEIGRPTAREPRGIPGDETLPPMAGETPAATEVGFLAGSRRAGELLRPLR